MRKEVEGKFGIKCRRHVRLSYRRTVPRGRRAAPFWLSGGHDATFET